jgi:hypothetical protein
MRFESLTSSCCGSDGESSADANGCSEFVVVHVCPRSSWCLEMQRDVALCVTWGPAVRSQCAI